MSDITKEIKVAKQIVNKEGIVVPEGAEMEDFRRPNHYDFMTTMELQVARFSGIRHNRITDNLEIWIDGSKMVSISKEQVAKDPLCVNRAYQEIFQLPHVLPDTPECREWGAYLDKKVEEVVHIVAKEEPKKES